MFNCCCTVCRSQKWVCGCQLHVASVHIMWAWGWMFVYVCVCVSVEKNMCGPDRFVDLFCRPDRYVNLFCWPERSVDIFFGPDWSVNLFCRSHRSLDLVFDPIDPRIYFVDPIDPWIYLLIPIDLWCYFLRPTETVSWMYFWDRDDPFLKISWMDVFMVRVDLAFWIRKDPSVFSLRTLLHALSGTTWKRHVENTQTFSCITHGGKHSKITAHRDFNIVKSFWDFRTHTRDHTSTLLHTLYTHTHTHTHVSHTHIRTLIHTPTRTHQRNSQKRQI